MGSPAHYPVSLLEQGPTTLIAGITLKPCIVYFEYTYLSRFLYIYIFFIQKLTYA